MIVGHCNARTSRICDEALFLRFLTLSKIKLPVQDKCFILGMFSLKNEMVYPLLTSYFLFSL
jgi:hypothetical protein